MVYGGLAARWGSQSIGKNRLWRSAVSAMPHETCSVERSGISIHRGRLHPPRVAASEVIRIVFVCALAVLCGAAEPFVRQGVSWLLRRVVGLRFAATVSPVISVLGTGAMLGPILIYVERAPRVIVVGYIVGLAISRYLPPGGRIDFERAK
jgi:hypothetical protein